MWQKALEIYTPFICGKWQYLFHDKNENSGNSGARVIKAYLACNIHFQLFQMKGEEFVENFGLMHFIIFQNILQALDQSSLSRILQVGMFFEDAFTLALAFSLSHANYVTYQILTYLIYLNWLFLFVLCFFFYFFSNHLFVPTRKL